MTEWRFLTATTWSDSRLVVGGLNPKDWEWRSTGEGIRVPDPQDGHMRGPAVYEIGPEDAPVRFAAEEVSNGVVCYWVPEG